MILETEKFNTELKEMKTTMTNFEKRLYGIVLNGANANDLDILLTLVYVSGKSQGIEISRDVIKEAAAKMGVDLGGTNVN